MSKLSNKLTAFIFVGVLLLLFTSPIIKLTSQEDEVIKIRKLERISTGHGESLTHKYIVSAEKPETGEFEVFENTDVVWFFKFNSADIQNTFEVGKTYRVKVYGFRIPFFSMYRNIVKIYPDTLSVKPDVNTSIHPWVFLF